jgi:hypothetical protein
MKTRAEIEVEYDVRDGVIRSPGKFEGEPTYAVALYDAVMYGCVDDTLYWSDENSTDLFQVDDELRAEFPAIAASTAWIALEETDQGFVNTTDLTLDEYEQLLARYEDDASSEGGDELAGKSDEDGPR